MHLKNLACESAVSGDQAIDLLERFAWGINDWNTTIARTTTEYSSILS